MHRSQYTVVRHQELNRCGRSIRVRSQDCTFQTKKQGGTRTSSVERPHWLCYRPCQYSSSNGHKIQLSLPTGAGHLRPSKPGIVRRIEHERGLRRRFDGCFGDGVAFVRADSRRRSLTTRFLTRLGALIPIGCDPNIYLLYREHTLLRRRADYSWALGKAEDMAHSLEGCVSSLRETLSLLDSSISTLDAGVNDFPRLSKVLQTTRVRLKPLLSSSTPAILTDCRSISKSLASQPSRKPNPPCFPKSNQKYPHYSTV